MHVLTPRPSLRAFLLCALLAPHALPHGGTYAGPVDAPPAGRGGGASGTPGGGAPSTPSPSGPGTPGPAGPGAPSGGVGAPSASTGGVDAGPDVTAWQYWWTFNREPYLRLKQRLGDAVHSGSDEFFLGRGQETPALDSLRATRQRIREEIVPALARMLDSERSNDIQSACMIALARIGDERGEDGLPRTDIGGRLVERLDDANQEVAETAALALGILGDGSHAALLQAILADEREVLRAAGMTGTSALPMRTRAFAAYGLGQLASRLPFEQRAPLVEALQAALERERGAAQPDVAMALVAALGLAPLPAAPEADGGSPRSAQIRHLLGLYADAARPALVRAHVPVALSRLLVDGSADEDTLREVLAVLCSNLREHGGESGVLEQSAVLALGQLADCGSSAQAVEARAVLMRKAAEDADEQVRTFAMIALGQAGARPGTGRDWSGLAGQDGVRAFLVARLGSGKVAIRSWSALALAVLERGLDEAGGPGSDAAREALVECLAEARNPEEIGALAIACGLVRERRASAPLRAALDTLGDAEARGHLCVALGLLGDAGAKPAIEQVIRRSSYQPGLLKSAAIGLGLMGDRDVALELVELLEGAHSLASQASISQALGFIGDDRSIRPLTELLGDPERTALARAFAAAALGIVGDKDDLPWGSRYSIDVNYRANAATLIDPGGSLGLLNLL